MKYISKNEQYVISALFYSAFTNTKEPSTLQRSSFLPSEDFFAQMRGWAKRISMVLAGKHFIEKTNLMIYCCICRPKITI